MTAFLRLRRRLAAAGLASLSLAGILPSGPAAAAPPPRPHPLLVALGDSISYGYNLGPSNAVPSPYAFPFVMARAEEMPVRDLAVPGWTSQNLLAALSTPSFARHMMRASIITIDIGSNNLLQLAEADGLFPPTGSPPVLTPRQEAQFQAAIARFARTLPAIVAKVRRDDPTARLILYNLYNPIPPSDAALYALADTLVGKMNRIVAGVAAAYRVPLANAYLAFLGHESTDIIPGDVHPSIAGQAVLAHIGEAALAGNRSPR